MHNLFDILHDFQRLRAKRVLAVPLDESEEAELEGLERLLLGDTPRDVRRRMPRVACPVPVQLTAPGGFWHGRVENVSGTGFRIMTPCLAKVGAEVLVELLDPVRGMDYVFPCRVVWRGEGVMGLAFAGVPSRRPVAKGPTTPRGHRVTPGVRTLSA